MFPRLISSLCYLTFYNRILSSSSIIILSLILYDAISNYLTVQHVPILLIRFIPETAPFSVLDGLDIVDFGVRSPSSVLLLTGPLVAEILICSVDSVNLLSYSGIYSLSNLFTSFNSQFSVFYRREAPEREKKSTRSNEK